MYSQPKWSYNELRTLNRHSPRAVKETKGEIKMVSRKTVILLLILLFLLPLTACSRDNENNGNGEPDPDPPEQTILAGIALGDPASKVIQLYGNQYIEDTLSADDSYYGQDVANWNYQDRIYFTIGQSTQTVLRVYVTVPEYETNLAVKVGQRAVTFLPLYRGYYEELVSYHSDDVLYGWFQVEDGGLLIFRFTDGDIAIEGGVPIPDQAIVDNITLAYQDHFD